MSTKKVLLVEDDVVTAKIIAAHLKALGYTVTAIVASEIEVIASIKTDKPDLVLMDIYLGTETNDGIAISTRIKNQFQIPTIFLTANHSADIFEQAQTSAPFGYITKPCSQDDLNIAIQMAFHRHNIEQKLADRNAVLSTILNSTSDGVVAVDVEGKITYMNPAAENITGSSLAEVYGQKSTNVISFVSELTNRPVVNPLIQTMELQKACYLSDRTALVAKSGIKVPVTDSASPIFSTDLIDDVLTLGRAEAGMIEFNPAPLDLAEYCQDLVHEMQLVVASSIVSTPGLELIFDCDLESYPALVDENLLQQIFPNLLTNAIKYSKPGTKVVLNLECTSDMAVFRVIDSGIGIPEAEIPFLFQPFRRASNVGGVRGSGIGLAIVKRAVELHGGKIYVKTEINQGTTFTVLLPISPPNLDQSLSSQPLKE